MDTIVIFRKYRKAPHDVFALFPEEAANNQCTLCLSYEHFGQHSGADYSLCIRISKPASPEEYTDLLQELHSRGYTLKILQRRPRGCRPRIA